MTYKKLNIYTTIQFLNNCLIVNYVFICFITYFTIGINEKKRLILSFNYSLQGKR
jgi:hypothetical protein